MLAETFRFKLVAAGNWILCCLETGIHLLELLYDIEGWQGCGHGAVRISVSGLVLW